MRFAVKLTSSFRTSRTGIIFLVAVFIPSLVLGWLALRSAGEQRTILERQAVAIQELRVEELAASIRAEFAGRFAQFIGVVPVADSAPRADTARRFVSAVDEAFPYAQPFVLDPGGDLLVPGQSDGPVQRKFIIENEAFLSGERAESVYQSKASYRLAAPAAASARNRGDEKFAHDAPKEKGATLRAGNDDPSLASKGLARRADSTSSYSLERKAEASTPAAESYPGQSPENMAKARQVVPQQQSLSTQPPMSRLIPELADFQALTANANSGYLARFVQNQLQVFLWVRMDGWIFGVMLPDEVLSELARNAAQAVRSADSCLAILNERGHPVFLTRAGFEADWKRPFVSVEIGEELPQWEAAAYLLDPSELETSALTMQLVLVSLIALALAAIVAGGWFLFTDARRQLLLAQKKSDFVSNVSHELKTPLTSIRMFGELLGQADLDPDKKLHYAGIITLEAERLTRLIHNVLDFARIERGGKISDRRRVDLYPTIARIWEALGIHLKESGFRASWEATDPPYWVNADPDAVAQIVVNLVSNAEKYAGEERAVELQTSLTGDSLCLSVLDRGIGVPPGHEGKIFEPFHRAHDSLASGTHGSGLGLTLAKRIAAEHGGTIEYAPRAGGGSVFTLRLPLTPP